MNRVRPWVLLVLISAGLIGCATLPRGECKSLRVKSDAIPAAFEFLQIQMKERNAYQPEVVPAKNGWEVILYKQLAPPDSEPYVIVPTCGLPYHAPYH